MPGDFGKLVKKKYIGDDLQPVEIEDIPRAISSLPDIMDPYGTLCGGGNGSQFIVKMV